jgi:hypothetical protein
MNQPRPSQDFDRLLELLVQQATGTLSDTERADLDAFLARTPPLTDEAGRPADTSLFDPVIGATVAALAARSPTSALPADVRARLLTRGVTLIRQPNSAAPTHHTLHTRRGLPQSVAWLVAAAACFLAAFVWFQNRPAPTPGAPELLASLMAEPDTLQLPFEPSQDPAAATLAGDVFWNQRLQRGYLRFTGLAANDPAREQYQIWAYDSGRQDGNPVDCGVFDVAAPGTDHPLVPILGKLPVLKATAFAITIERPGGAVIPNRERLVCFMPKK